MLWYHLQVVGNTSHENEILLFLWTNNFITAPHGSTSAMSNWNCVLIQKWCHCL